MNTYCIIFAGRKDRMELTMNYINEALNEGILTKFIYGTIPVLLTMRPGSDPLRPIKLRYLT